MAHHEKDVKIVACDITEDMKLRAIESTLQQEKNIAKSNREDYELLAKNLKKDFDTRFHPTWQCIVGTHYGSDVGYFEKNMIYFYVGNIAILLWKAG